MQGSTPRTRNTFPLSAARNFDGTVSRFFASSVWSKVPWKAKAHVLAAKGVSRSEVAEWEEPRHPGPASRLQGTPLPPTLQHNSLSPAHGSSVRSRSGRQLRRFAGLSGVV